MGRASDNPNETDKSEPNPPRTRLTDLFRDLINKTAAKIPEWKKRSKEQPASWQRSLRIGLIDCMHALLKARYSIPLLFYIVSLTVVLGPYYRTSDSSLTFQLLVSGCLILVGLSAWAQYFMDSQRFKIEDIVHKALAVNSDQILNRTPMFKWLIEKYAHKDCTKKENPISAIRGLVRKSAEQIKTKEIAELFQRRASATFDATDYMCVIRANAESALLAPSELNNQFCYYLGFSRKYHPRHRITRIFSVPMKVQSNQKLDWNDHNALTVEQRKLLLLYLFLNKAVGVEAKLHIFDPDATSSDFFQAADYVFWVSPTGAKDSEPYCLFLAIPGDENECIKITDAPLLFPCFQYEFYSRMTSQGSDVNKQSIITDVVRPNRKDIARHLSLGADEIAAVRSSLETSINYFKEHRRVHGCPIWTDDALTTLQTRWDNWYKEQDVAIGTGAQ